VREPELDGLVLRQPRQVLARLGKGGRRGKKREERARDERGAATS